MERELTVRHVFVGFVEGKESGIRSPECGIRNPFNVTCWSILYSFILSLLAENSIRITIIISSLTLQDIEQNVSELTLAGYLNVSSAAT